MTARAQIAPWGLTVHATGEFDTDHVSLLMGGIAFAPRTHALVPMGGVMGYSLRSSPASGETDKRGIQPYVGLQQNFGAGLLSARVGYQLESSDVILAAAGIAQGTGTVIGGQLEAWSESSGLGMDVVGNCNIAASTFWTRGRATAAIVRRGSSSLRVGAEAAWLNIGGDDDFESGSVGGSLSWQSTRRMNAAFAAGKRFIDSQATYFRVELTLPFR